MSYIQNPAVVLVRRMTNPLIGMVIDYPVVTGLRNPAAQQTINASIQRLVKALIAQQTGKTGNPDWPPSPIQSMQGWFELKTNERGVLSLSIGNYTYPYHAAHGLTLIKSLTFDTDTGIQYSLSSLFKPGSNYVQVLSAIVGEQIRQRNLPVLGEYTGISPEQDYYLSDNVLVLYFQLYDLVPYAYGFPMFPIPLYTIEELIPENGILSRLMING